MKGCAVAGAGMGFQDDQDPLWLVAVQLVDGLNGYLSEQKCSTPGHCWCDVGVSLEFLGQPLQGRKKRCGCGCIVIGVTVL